MDSITKYSMESSQQDNGTPQIRIGKEANLDFFQSLVNDNNNDDKMMMNPTCHFQQSLPDDNDEALLLPEAMSVKVTLQATQTDSTLVQEFKDIPGTLFITTERLVFVSSKDDNNNNNNDFSIHAACLLLHAISQDGLYIQVQDVNEEKDGFELTITPTPTTTTTLQQQQQVMFDALTKLVSLHPIMDDDDDEEEDTIGFFNDNAVMAPPRTAREEMLQRLDEMLVVVEPPPSSEYHHPMVVVQGQFDDAHEPPQEEQHDMNASNDNNNDEELL
jgi:hypothetical protein